MMSSFLFGVAFDRLRFSALKRYLLKNSSSMETEIRSLILPLNRPHNACSEYLSLYLRSDASSYQKPTVEASSSPRYSPDSAVFAGLL
jgi:hypothetical protein